MLFTTSGIVLRLIKYSDNSVIVKVYTELFGLQSYLINIGKNPKSRSKTNILQPLSLLDMTVWHKDRPGLQRIKEISSSLPLLTVHSNPYKTGIVFFIAEIIYKSIKEEERNSSLFAFLHHTILQLDVETGNFSNFHLAFLVEYSKYLGIFPKTNYNEANIYFDLLNGVFTDEIPIHAHNAPATESALLYQFFINPFENHSAIKITTPERRLLLGILIEYFRLHLDGMSEIKSHLVLAELG